MDAQAVDDIAGARGRISRVALPAATTAVAAFVVVRRLRRRTQH
jgi:hypothetical protein